MAGKKYLFCSILLWLGISANSQDIHFSQFYNSPLTLNPALTGNFEGDWRLMNHYRNQWMALPVPFRTITAGADHVFYRQNDVIGAGIYVINDKSGAINLDVNKIYLSGSYDKHLLKFRISAGLQVGYVYKLINFNSLTFPSQYDHSIGDFNTALANNESGNNDHAEYLDINTGIRGSTVLNNIKLDGGLAFYHINHPKESFTGIVSNLPMRTVIHCQAERNITHLWYIKPAVLLMFHKKANDLILGSDVGFRLSGSPAGIEKIYGGMYFRDGISRNAESLILSFGSRWKRISVGISYDIGFSNVKTATGKRGSLELSLIYTSPGSFPNKIAIPCNIY